MKKIIFISVLFLLILLNGCNFITRTKVMHQTAECSYMGEWEEKNPCSCILETISMMEKEGWDKDDELKKEYYDRKELYGRVCEIRNGTICWTKYRYQWGPEWGNRIIC